MTREPETARGMPPASRDRAAAKARRCTPCRENSSFAARPHGHARRCRRCGSASEPQHEVQQHDKTGSSEETLVMPSELAEPASAGGPRPDGGPGECRGSHIPIARPPAPAGFGIVQTPIASPRNVGLSGRPKAPAARRAKGEKKQVIKSAPTRTPMSPGARNRIEDKQARLRSNYPAGTRRRIHSRRADRRDPLTGHQQLRTDAGLM